MPGEPRTTRAPRMMLAERLVPFRGRNAVTTAVSRSAGR